MFRACVEQCVNEVVRKKPMQPHSLSLRIFNRVHFHRVITMVSDRFSDPRAAMSAHVVATGRTPRARSCRKRSYTADGDSSPEVKSSTSKKPKPPLTATTPTTETQAHRGARNRSSAKNVQTPVGETKDPAEKILRRGRPRKGNQQAAVQATPDSRGAIT